MNFLIDSNVLIDYLRGNESIGEYIFKSKVSCITYAEILYGEYKFVSKVKAIKNISNFFEDFEIDIVPLSTETVNYFVKIKVELENKGLKLEDFDLLIAATAISLNLTLVTSNAKHFSRIPELKLKKLI